MKKRILAVFLAALMVLSLMPMWVFAETTYVAEIGSTKYQTLDAAINAANGGDTITLLKDVSYATNGSGLWNITKSITLDGNGYSLNGWGSRLGNKTTLAINNNGSSTVNVTLKNLTINNAANPSPAGRVIETRGKIGTLTLDNVIINATGGGGTQGLTIGGNQSSTAKIVIKNHSEINAGDSGYPIIIYNPVDMEVEDSTLSGYCAVYFKGIDGSAGSANSVVYCDRTKIISPNVHASGDGWNNFGAFPFEDKNGNTKVTLNDCEIHTNEENTAHQYIFAPNLSAGTSVGNDSNIVLEITGDSTIVNTDRISKAPISETLSYTTKMVIYGGIYSTNELLDQLVATDYKVIPNPDTATNEKYPYKVVPKTPASVAQIGTTKFQTLQDAFDAAEDNQTIQLLADVPHQQIIFNKSGKTVTLDLNGFTVSDGPYEAGDGSYTVSRTIAVNAGNLIIDDTVGGGKIVSKEATTYGSNYALYLYGNTGDTCSLTLKNGTVESSKIGLLISSRASATIEGGKIIANGGNTSYDQAIQLSGDALTITGGEFESDGKTLYVKDIAEITGGYFKGVISNKGSQGFLKGGYYSNNPGACVASSYEAVATNAADAENGVNIDTYKFKVVPKFIEVVDVNKETIKSNVATAVEAEIEGSLAEEKAGFLEAAVGAAVEELIGNTEITKVETKAAEAVKDDRINSIIERAAAQANQKEDGSGEAFKNVGTTTDTKIEIKLESIKVDTQSVIEATAATAIKVNTAVYDVKPIATVTTTITTDAGTETIKETVVLTNDDLNGKSITVRLAVLSTSAKVARITHKGDSDHEDEVFYTKVLGEGSNQYVEIQMTHFSEVDVETLTATTGESHKMGHQYKIVGGQKVEGVGRAIIPLSAAELTAIGNNHLTVYGGEGDKRTTFTIDCAYTYFYNYNVESGTAEKIEATGDVAAFLIIDKDGYDNEISGYGYYEFYVGAKQEGNPLFYALFNAPAND